MGNPHIAKAEKLLESPAGSSVARAAVQAQLAVAYELRTANRMNILMATPTPGSTTERLLVDLAKDVGYATR